MDGQTQSPLAQFLSDGKQNQYSPEQLNAINEQRKQSGKGIPGWEQFYDTYKQQIPKKEENENSPRQYALAGAELSLAGFGVGSLLEKFGKGMYKAGLPKLEGEVSRTLQGKDIVKKMVDTGKKYGLVGTRSSMARKSYKSMTDIFEKYINPAIDKLDKAGAKVSYGGIKLNAIDNLMNNPQLDDVSKIEIKEAIEEFIDDRTSKVGKNIGYGQLQKSKSNLDTFASKKVASGKISANTMEMAKKYVADSMRDTLHEGLGSVGLKDSRELMADYANLNAVYKKGIKAGLEDPIGGVLGMQSAAIKSAGVPISTVGGRVLEGAGKGLKEASLIPTIKRAGSNIINKLKKTPTKTLGKTAGVLGIAGVAQQLAPDPLAGQESEGNIPAKMVPIAQNLIGKYKGKKEIPEIEIVRAGFMGNEIQAVKNEFKKRQTGVKPVELKKGTAGIKETLKKTAKTSLGL